MGIDKDPFMKEKLGILTFHASNNYGAVLQTYALSKTLQDLYPERDVCVLDYRGKGTTSSSSFSDIRRKKGFFRGLLHYHQIRIRSRGFDEFRRKYLHLSKKYDSPGEIRKDMDTFRAIISGSDQVWNLKVSGNDMTYFQDFHTENTKKYSYAASIGMTSVSEEQTEIFKNTLNQFQDISVREGSAADLLQSILDVPVVQHVDPTLLLGEKEWDSIAKMPDIAKGYILVYMVPKQESLITYAQELSRKRNLPIVMLSKNILPLNVIHKGNSSPEEFVGLMRNAACVLTNSFHGTAFACIYHKELWADLLSEKGFNTRVESLIRLHGLDKCIHDHRFVSVTPEDWKSSREYLNREIASSKEYLRNMIQS